MNQLSEQELENLANRFNYSNLLERYKVMEKYFDIQNGDIVIDAGAYQGDMAQYFCKKVGTLGKVYSVEPLKDNILALTSFKLRDRLDNLVVVPVALWNKNEKIPFYLSNYTNAGSLLEDFRKVGNESINILAYTLDFIVKKYRIPKVDYIWSNIEGCEINFLKGSKQTLLNNNCRLCISTHKINEEYTDTEDVIKILNEYGYTTEQIENHEMWIYAEKE